MTDILGSKIVDISLPQVERYHDHPYGFQYNPSLRLGRMIIELGSGKRDFMRIRDDVAEKICILLQFKNPNDADCHVTADYIAGFGDNIGRVEESWRERVQYMISTDGKNQDYDRFSSLGDAMEAHKGYTFLCRIYDQHGICHSLVVLGTLGDGTVMGFEHRGQGTDWGFCEVEKAIQARSGEDLFCKRI